MFCSSPPPPPKNPLLSRWAFLLQTFTTNQTPAKAFRPGLCGGEDPRTQMTSVGVWGRRDPPCRPCWDAAPHPTPFPAAALSNVLACSCSDATGRETRTSLIKHQGDFYHAHSHSVYMEHNRPGGELASPSPSLGTFSQSRSTFSEATCEQSEPTFCTHSVI